MLNYDEVVKNPDRRVILEYMDKETKESICKLALTTLNSKVLYLEKEKRSINLDELMETADNILIIPIQ